ncbi:endonuclease [Calidifontimicrobium sp. SYSU G02091]|jgi:crossover junction endodeoxyribonuclease RusA|uniref:endonuclease n=1 Tax=Calidifontimicrobium sp. SYSU G02091 TaxID=2926421 RepID=UPI001F5353B3|nr:endonuclease [Calidifontimicrobium sp. SYSU G02091]MCI1193531.1 endonuclease [Calidifontimicrobium sp. SYSU G02091]
MTALRIVLPWPPAALSPNGRLHWAAKARAAGTYRRACRAQALEQGALRIEADRLHVALTFVPPDRRHYDLDNLLARMKSGLDGLASVLGVDDSRWSLSIERAQPPGGYVQVVVTG